MDRRTLALVAACLILIVFWWPIMDRLGFGRYNPAHRPPPTAIAPETSAVETSRIGPQPARATAAPGPSAGMPVNGATLSSLPPAATRSAIERTVSIVTPLYHATFSTRGARLLSVELLHFAASHGASNFGVHGRIPRRDGVVPEGDRVVLAGAPTFGIDLGSGSSQVSLANADYAVAESSDAAGQVRTLTFTLQDSSGLHLRQVWRVRPDSYALDLAVEMDHLPPALRLSDYSLTTRSWPLLTERDPASDDRMLRA